MLVLLAHAAATCALAGIVWLVQLVVYPAFLRIGPTAAWADHHAAHSRGLALTVGLPWVVQGASLAVLLVRRPEGVSLWLVLLAAALGLLTVGLTVAVALPLHERLGRSYDERAALRLLRSNRLRVAAWTAAAATGLVMVVQAA